MLVLLASAILGRSIDPSVKPVGNLTLPTRLNDCHHCSIRATLEPGVAGWGTWVRVQIDGVAYGSNDDWVGVFAPEDVDSGVINRYPIRYQRAGTSCSPRDGGAPPAPGSRCAGDACCVWNDYEKTGSATLGFKLIDMRTDYIFALVQGSEQFPSVIAVSERLVAFADVGAPSQIHLALTAKPSYVLVSWTSGNVSGFASAPPSVRWGRSPGAFTSSAIASARTYSAEQLCDHGGPAANLGWRDPGMLWSGQIGPLAPGETIYYTVGSDAAGAGWSHLRADAAAANLSFAAPEPEADAVRLLAFGDMGKAPSAWDGSLEHSWDNYNHGEVPQERPAPRHPPKHDRVAPCNWRPHDPLAVACMAGWL